ncbi:MAG: hypothetical protein ACMUIL_02845 [bacterium]
MHEDIRDKAYLTHKDIVALNFIRNPCGYVFRRHFRDGLRSHIMEVLHPEEVRIEAQGIATEGTRRFPRATPRRMLRIFKTRFRDLDEAGQEVRRVKIIGSYLAPGFIARSQEFLVHFIQQGKREILLCGLQEYVAGVVLDPWGVLDSRQVISFLYELGYEKGEDAADREQEWVACIREKAREFLCSLKRMIMEAHYVPDLAGIGNLILTPSGDIKLVDINNISPVYLDFVIRLDDRLYPVCDKSIEAMSRIETGLLNEPLGKKDPIYARFLDSGRMEEVRRWERRFHHNMEQDMDFPD